MFLTVVVASKKETRTSRTCASNYRTLTRPKPRCKHTLDTDFPQNRSFTRELSSKLPHQEGATRSNIFESFMRA